MPINHNFTMEILPKKSPRHHNINGKSNHPSPVEKESDPLLSPDWEKVFQRVLIYLQALSISAEKAQKIAREAIKLAQSQTSRISPEGFYREAMKSLRTLLSREFPEIFKVNLPTPPINRSFMVPENIDLRPWLTFVSRKINQFGTILSQPLVLLILFLIGLASLIFFALRK